MKAPALYLFAFALAQVGIMSVLPTFWSLPTAFLSGTAAAGGIALINSVGNLGGFFGPNLIGQLRASTGSFSPGMLAVAATLVIGAVLALCVRDDDAKPAKSVDLALRLRKRPNERPSPLLELATGLRGRNSLTSCATSGLNVQTAVNILESDTAALAAGNSSFIQYEQPS